MDSIAMRYADALLKIAQEEDQVDKYLAANDFVLDVFEEIPEFYTVLTSQFISKQERIALIDKVLENFALINYQNFFKLLIQRNRLSYFAEIATEFKRMAKAAVGVIEGVVYSVQPLDEQTIKAIETAISKKRSQTVELKNELENELIGGIKVVVGDEVYDGSITTKIEQLKAKLNQGRSG